MAPVGLVPSVTVVLDRLVLERVRKVLTKLKIDDTGGTMEFRKTSCRRVSHLPYDLAIRVNGHRLCTDEVGVLFVPGCVVMGDASSDPSGLTKRR